MTYAFTDEERGAIMRRQHAVLELVRAIGDIHSLPVGLVLAPDMSGLMTPEEFAGALETAVSPMREVKE